MLKTVLALTTTAVTAASHGSWIHSLADGLAIVAPHPDDADAGAPWTATAELRPLLAALRDAPVEDGLIHPGEEALGEIVRRGRGPSLLELITGSRVQPSLAADLVRLLGRLPEVPSALRGSVVETALRSPAIELRDAAMQAFESWGDRSLVAMLRRHSEPVAWLAEYQATLLRETDGT